jgi:hypothetical protein
MIHRPSGGISMMKLAFTAVIAFTMFATAASAEEGFAFTVQNDTGTAITVYANERSKCDLVPGGSCRITVPSEDTSFSYAKAGGARIAFSPGNLEAIDLCRLNANGEVHCVDPYGK